MKILLALLALAAPALGQHTHQHILDLAAPGATVRLPGWPTGKRLVIRKPATIVFLAALDFPPGTPDLPAYENVILDGPGAGELTIAGLRIAYPQVPQHPYGASYSAGLHGDGFSDVRLVDCNVYGYTDLGASAEYVELVRSRFQTGPGLAYTYPDTFCAPEAAVVMLDSWVGWAGGVHPGLCLDALLTDQDFGYPPGYLDGIPYGVLDQDLTLAGKSHPGRTLTLSWSMPHPATGLFFDLGNRRPVHIYPGAHGVAFLSPQATLVGWGGATGSAQVSLPATPLLIGERVTFQAFNPPGRFSRPQITVIQ